MTAFVLIEIASDSSIEIVLNTVIATIRIATAIILFVTIVLTSTFIATIIIKDPVVRHVTAIGRCLVRDAFQITRTAAASMSARGSFTSANVTIINLHQNQLAHPSPLSSHSLTALMEPSL